jgi:chromosome segregation ATPase
MADGTPAIEAPAPVGHNMPPEEGAKLSPFDAVRIHMEDLLTEARNWADGVAVENQDQADEVSRLIEDLRKAGEAADEQRAAEKAPLDEKIAEIQERYNAYIAGLKSKHSKPGSVTRAIDALKATLHAYLAEVDRRQRAEAEAARVVAEEAAAKAAEAARAADPANLEEREAAEELITEARRAEHTARQAEAAKPQAAGGTRAMGLRKTYTAELTDPKAALVHYWTTNRAPLLAVLQQMAQQDVNRSVRTIPGVKVVEGTRL